eukprot:7088522-Pyramimonas_sp.AAC.1
MLTTVTASAACAAATAFLSMVVAPLLMYLMIPAGFPLELRRCQCHHTSLRSSRVGRSTACPRWGGEAGRCPSTP